MHTCQPFFYCPAAVIVASVREVSLIGAVMVAATLVEVAVVAAELVLVAVVAVTLVSARCNNSKSSCSNFFLQ